jgi:two-component system, NtrC family, response regulator AtoC
MQFVEIEIMSKLIYFVDDDKMILNLLEYTFSSRDNYSVKTFRTGEDFFNALDQKPDLIVLDHSFILTHTASKFNNGLEILQKIREKNIDVPVIALSGEHNENIIDQYIANGTTKFILKDSYFIDSLIESIDEVFSETES